MYLFNLKGDGMSEKCNQLSGDYFRNKPLKLFSAFFFFFFLFVGVTSCFCGPTVKCPEGLNVSTAQLPWTVEWIHGWYFQTSHVASRWQRWASCSSQSLYSLSSSSVCPLTSLCSVWSSHSESEGANMPCTAVSGLEKETRDFVWSACFHCGLFLCTYRVPPLPSSVPSASSLWSFRQIRLVSMSVWMLALLQGEIIMSRAAEDCCCVHLYSHDTLNHSMMSKSFLLYTRMLLMCVRRSVHM